MAGKPLDGQLLDVITMLVVNELDKSVAFYQDKLGFEVRDHSMEHIALLGRGSMLLYLFTTSPPTPDKPGITLANLNTPDQTPVIIDLHVRDCRLVYEELRAHGVEFLTPPKQPPWGGWRCFARDPNGYLIEIEES